jgi:hypothetical protein
MARLAWPLLAATLGERVRYDQCAVSALIALQSGRPCRPGSAEWLIPRVQMAGPPKASRRGKDGRPGDPQ